MISRHRACRSCVHPEVRRIETTRYYQTAVTGAVTGIEQIAARENCSVRQVNMTNRTHEFCAKEFMAFLLVELGLHCIKEITIEGRENTLRHGKNAAFDKSI